MMSKKGSSGSKSELLTVNRLLNPGGVGYTAGSEEASRGPLLGAPKRGQPLRRRHTVDDDPPASRRGSMSLRKGSRAGVPEPEPVEEPPPPKKPEKEKDTTDALACRLALQHQLMLSEVKCIIKEFLKAPRNAAGGLAPEDFDTVMARIFDVPVINPTVSKVAYVQTGIEKEINIQNFLAWYVQNMFTSVSALTADPAMASSNALAYSVAAKHKVSNMAVDKMKSKFDHYDRDNSGKIEYCEFEAMFMEILKVKEAGDLNPDRMRRFWNQVDKNGDGAIDFSEFADWYLKYFSPDTENDEWDMAGPLQKFYDGFNPSVQRRLNLEATQKKAQTLGD